MGKTEDETLLFKQTGILRNSVGKVTIIGTIACFLFIILGAFPNLAFACSYMSDSSFADQLIRSSVGNVFYLIEGAFGALVMVFSFIIAVMTSSMGHEKTALGFILLAITAFILRLLVALFFSTDSSYLPLVLF